MTQFAVYRNADASTKGRFPLLLDVQSDLLGELGTRVVVPLTPASPAGRRAEMQTLTPQLIVENKNYLLITPQLAGIAARKLGAPVANLGGQRSKILAALDLLFTDF